MTPPLQLSIDDPLVDRVASSHARGIAELQSMPAASLRIISNVLLVDTANTYVEHGLGRAPLFVRESCVRGALSTGIVRDVTDGKLTGLFSTPVDRSRYVVLRADGYSANIFVDILVL